MSHAQLSMLRDQLPPDHPLQALIAPHEHTAFAREWTQDNPMVAAPALALAAPLYYLAKQPSLVGLAQRLGLVGDNPTPASTDQLLAAYRGIGQGLGIN